MQIKSIRAFGCFDPGFSKELRLELPDAGVVLVTGRNGHGKSSIIESVGAAMFGATLRGVPPWVDGRAAAVRVATARETVTRRRTKSGKVSLEVAPVDGTWPEYETTTKCQNALESRVGGFELWRRSCVFSSADAAHFTLATDKERKRFLETLIGLGRFDGALAACKDQLRSWRSNAQAAQAARNGAHIEASAARVAIADFEDSLSALGPAPAGLEAEIAGLRAELVEVEAECARFEISRPPSARICEACGQPVPDLAARKAEEERNRAYRDVQRRAGDLRVRIAGLEAQAKSAAQLGAERARLEGRISAAKDRLATSTAAEGAAVQEATSAAHEVEVLEACEQVLGLRGLRAQVLGSALAGIEAAACSWLSRLAPPEISIRLRVDEGDALVVEVDGWGGGKGYRACSAGQRRRIDVALLLALVEVAGAAHGQTGATLFLDECLDSLDDEGVDAVCRALPDLARDCCVVLITHNAALAGAVEAVVRYRVEDGEVHPV